MFDKHPHDRFFKATFSNKNIVKGYLKNFLPKEIVTQLDFRTLKPSSISYIDKNLSEHLSDIVYFCRHRKEKTIQLSFLLEHQSTILKYPHLKILKYQTNGWEYQLQQNEPLQLIIPIIIYHGKRKWHYKPFSEYFNVRDRHLKQFIPNFEYVLTDLSQYSDEDLMKLKLGFLVASFLLLKHHHERDFIIEKAVEIFQYSITYSEGGRIEDTYYRMAIVYIARAFKIEKQEIKIIIDSIPNKLKDSVMTAYDQIVQEGFEKGIQEGIQKNKVESIAAVIQNMPHLSNAEVAKIFKVDISFVKEIRDK